MQEWKGFLPANAIIMAKLGASPETKSGPKPSTKFVQTPSVQGAHFQAPSASVTAPSASAIASPPITPRVKLVFVGEMIQGQAAQLLDRMIEAMGVARPDISILSPDEAKSLELSTPHLFVTLGEKAAQALLQSSEPFAYLRSRFQTYRGSKLMAVFHPSELLKSPQLKKDVWLDLQKVVKELGIENPKK